MFFVVWKIKMDTILVKDGCSIALKGKSLKPTGMTDAQFVEKDEIDQIDLLLVLEDKVLFNVHIVNKRLCGRASTKYIRINHW